MFADACVFKQRGHQKGNSLSYSYPLTGICIIHFTNGGFVYSMCVYIVLYVYRAARFKCSLRYKCSILEKIRPGWTLLVSIEFLILLFQQI